MNMIFSHADSVLVQLGTRLLLIVNLLNVAYGYTVMIFPVCTTYFVDMNLTKRMFEFTFHKLEEWWLLFISFICLSLLNLRISIFISIFCIGGSLITTTCFLVVFFYF